MMPLAVRPAGLLPDLPSVVLRPQYPVQVHKGLSGWYVGAQAMWLSAQERSRSVAIRPNGRPVFASRQESADQSAWWGLRAGKKIGSRWSIETGIGYQRSERKASHQPRFRFADGLLGGGPGGPRAFSYEVPTYGGTAEVTLRMETTTPSSPPTPDEAVPLKISTTERSEVLRVPLLAAYRLGGKRWQAHLKAGVLVNVTLKQELDLAARVSQSSRFRPVDGQDGYTLQLKRAGNLGWGYALAAGTEYRLNRRWSVVAEPMLVGDFVRKDGAGQTLPQHTAWGLNAGVQMYF
ncbi:MAG TPA: hypothetical protein PKD78_01080 [Saprospiraceae bacterium]|nr:hypothetical protein [Saprospiraceae bacterium]